MKRYSQEEALHEIFFENKEPLSSCMRVYKSRLIRNKLGAHLIDVLLSRYNFVSARKPLYQKETKEVNYFRHVGKTEHIKADLNVKDFEEIFKRKKFEYEVPKNVEWADIMIQDNKFIRFTCSAKNEWYMDLTITRIIIKNNFIINLGEVIDYNKPR